MALNVEEVLDDVIIIVVYDKAFCLIQVFQFFARVENSFFINVIHRIRTRNFLSVTKQTTLVKEMNKKLL